jgi:hypothetical protein
MDFIEDASKGFRSRQRMRRIEFVVAILVKPRAGDIEQLEAWHRARKRERINGELSDGLLVLRRACNREYGVPVA